MPKYTVDVEIVRSYTVEVVADSPQEARKKVEEQNGIVVEADSNYVDTHTDVGTVYDENNNEVLEFMEE